MTVEPDLCDGVSMSAPQRVDLKEGRKMQKARGQPGAQYRETMCATGLSNSNKLQRDNTEAES